LAVERAVHDRYHASKRNPWNEVECGDHYARSMASYGVFLAACGFTYDGPKGEIGFAPRLSPEDFRAPFTAAEGWGTYSQKTEDPLRVVARFEVKWGALRLKTIAVKVQEKPAAVAVKVDGKSVEAKLEMQNEMAIGVLDQEIKLIAGQSLNITFGYAV